MSRNDLRKDITMRCAATAALVAPVLTIVAIEQLRWERSLVILLSWPAIFALYWFLKLIFVPKDDR